MSIMKMPAHVVQSLIEQGVMFADGMSRNARMGPCRKCRQIVVRGLDHDRCAYGATVDPYPLSPVGEVQALFAGRLTYRLTAHGAHAYRLDYRQVENITAHPAGGGPGDVVATHVCGAAHFDGSESRIVAIPTSSTGDEPCPF